MVHQDALFRGLAAAAVLTAIITGSFETSFAASTWTRSQNSSYLQTLDTYDAYRGRRAFGSAYDRFGWTDWRCSLSPGSIEYVPCSNNN
jgi:hypothetical protein